jgi:hypothetical protein
MEWVLPLTTFAPYVVYKTAAGVLAEGSWGQRYMCSPTTRSDASTNARTAGVHWRVDPKDVVILDGNDDRGRAELIAERLRRWKSIANA